jgi:hypothetical protein
MTATQGVENERSLARLLALPFSYAVMIDQGEDGWNGPP